MRNPVRILLCFLLAAGMIFGLFPTVFAAASFVPVKAPIPDETNGCYVYADEDYSVLDQDVFSRIDQLLTETARICGGVDGMSEQVYVNLIPGVIAAVESSETYVSGTLRQNGNFLVWETTVGIPCCYDPRMEAKLRNKRDASPSEETERTEADEKTAHNPPILTRGGAPSSANIGLVQPFWESSSSYADASFNGYSPYYKSMWEELCTATGGTGIRYSMTNATVDNIARTIEECGLVIIDSHGTTDYAGPNGDYTSRANCSYLCLSLSSDAGITSEDTAAQTGPFGTYYHYMRSSGYACISGTCIANHMTQDAPHSLVYLCICNGMATDGLFAGLRGRGVETVWGYTQSVTFKGERQYMESILGYVRDGDQFKDAVSKTKEEYGSWDPAYSSNSLAWAVANHVAFPICVSSEDAYPGHGNVDAVQTVRSTWTLFGEEAGNAISGTCGAEGDGSNLTWTLYLPTGKLAVSGEGNMKDYAPGKLPWKNHLADVKTVELSEGVTSIGDNAFSGCTGLTSARIPDSVTCIGDSSFVGCSSVTLLCSCGNLYVPGYAAECFLPVELLHFWDEPVYTWTEDLSSVSAACTCSRDTSHTAAETVQTAAEVTQEATLTRPGETTYTAVFTKTPFTTQTKVIATPKLKPETPFTDVIKGSYYYKAVLWAYDHDPQITAGITDTTFCPNDACTRGQVVTFLWRAAGAPKPSGSDNPFEDVKRGSYYYKAVLWAAEQGITAGTSKTTFSPDAGCTRGQVVTFLWRFAGKPKPASAEGRFEDMHTGSFYERAVLWATEKKITSGTSETTFSPEAVCTRGQIVTFLYRYMK